MLANGPISAKQWGFQRGKFPTRSTALLYTTHDWFTLLDHRDVMRIFDSKKRYGICIWKNDTYVRNGYIQWLTGFRALWSTIRAIPHFT